MARLVNDTPFRAILENSPVGAGVAAIGDGRIVYANARCGELFGVPPSELVGRSAIDVWHDQEDRRRCLSEFRRSGRVGERLVRLLGRDRQPFRCLLSWQSIPGDDDTAILFWLRDISDQERVEQRLRDSEARLHHIIDTASDWFWELDENLCVTFISPDYLKLTGCTWKDIAGRARFDVIHPENMKRNPDMWRRHRRDMEAHKPFEDIEVLVFDASGDCHTTLSNGNPVFAADGTFRGYRGISNDITEKKRAAEALRRSEQRFRDFTDTASDHYWELDRELRLSAISDTFLEIVGKRREDLFGLDRFEIVHPENLKRHPELWRRHRDDMENRRKFRDMPVLVRSKSGAWHEMLNHGNPVFDDDGAFAGYRCTATDITAQKRVEAELRESEKRFRDIADVASDWFWRMDADLRIDRVSARFFEVTGAVAEDIIGKTLREFLRRDAEGASPEALRRHLDDMDAHRPFQYFEHQLQSRDGRIIDIQISGKPLFDEDGTFLGYRGSGRDVTQRRQYERELARRNAQLAEAIRQKDRLMSIIGHDLKNPLNVVKAYAEMLSGAAATLKRATIADYAGTMFEASTAMLELLEDLLAWSLARAGCADASPEAFDPRRVVNGNLDLFAPMADSKSVNLAADVADGHMVHADPRMIDTVMRNLIGNALKFTEPGGRINVAIHAEAGNGTVHLSVHDSGVGIPANKLSGLFDSGAAGSTPGTDGERGTGLGLMLCKELVEANGGTLSVASTLGQGSTFRVTLPSAAGCPAPRN